MTTPPCTATRIAWARVTGLFQTWETALLLIAAVLHFVPDDTVAYDSVGQLVAALPHGSHLVASAAATAESFAPSDGKTQVTIEVYRRQTTTSAAARNRQQFERFFAGLELVEPGVVWLHQWPDRNAPSEFNDDPTRSGEWAEVGRK